MTVRGNTCIPVYPYRCQTSGYWQFHRLPWHVGSHVYTLYHNSTLPFSCGTARSSRPALWYLHSSHCLIDLSPPRTIVTSDCVLPSSAPSLLLHDTCLTWLSYFFPWCTLVHVVHVRWLLPCFRHPFFHCHERSVSPAPVRLH